MTPVEDMPSGTQPPAPRPARLVVPIEAARSIGYDAASLSLGSGWPVGGPTAPTGDWNDALLVPGGLGAVVGDIAGHGSRAAPELGPARRAARHRLRRDPRPGAVLGALAELARSTVPPSMCTCLVAVFEPDGLVRWARAGHPFPLYVGADGSTAYLEGAGAPPLGTAAPSQPPTHEVRLAPGDSLVIFTDGIVERRGESFDGGLGRLRAAAAGTTGGALELCRRLVDGCLPAGPLDDDACMLVVQRSR